MLAIVRTMQNRTMAGPMVHRRWRVRRTAGMSHTGRSLVPVW